MPNRILKESICRSDSIDTLSWFEEVLFYRLIVNCDDYGRFDGRPAIIKGSLFPLKDITVKDIEVTLRKLVSSELIIAYESEGRPIVQLCTWEKHQNVRAKKSKYPAYDETCTLMYTDDIEGTQKKVKAIAPTPEVVEPAIITLTLNTGEEYGITQEDISEWEELYPAVNVMQELRNMKGWCKENASKRKTERGIRKFINSWLSREQNKGGTPGYNRQINQSGSSKVEQFAAGAMGWANE